MSRCALILVAVLLSGCPADAPPRTSPASDVTADTGLAPPGVDAGPAPSDVPLVVKTVDALLECYEKGELSLPDLLAGLEPHAVSELSDPQIGGTIIIAGDAALTFPAKVVVASGARLVALPGAAIALAADGMEVAGQLYLLGTAEAPVTVKGGITMLGSGPSELRRVAIEGGTTLLSVRDTSASIRVVDCSFERWVDHALHFDGADGLRVSGGTFGLAPETPDYGEIVSGRASAVVIEGGTFGAMQGYRDAMDIEDCKGDHVPLIARNTFLGGEDDAIDLDDCDALVLNNLIMGYRPQPGVQSQGVNGGGITGDRTSEPVLIGNVVVDCHHGIGFKNGARPLLINNTVTGCHIGVALYQGDPSRPKPHGTLVNNVVTGNDEDLRLDGKWWPTYNQVDDVQATLDAHHNVFGIEVPGNANMVAGPDFDWTDELPVPQAGSAPIASALSTGLSTGPLTTAQIEGALAVDRAGTPRVAPFDRGAIERP